LCKARKNFYSFFQIKVNETAWGNYLSATFALPLFRFGQSEVGTPAVFRVDAAFSSLSPDESLSFIIHCLKEKLVALNVLFIKLIPPTAANPDS